MSSSPRTVALLLANLKTGTSIFSSVCVSVKMVAFFVVTVITNTSTSNAKEFTQSKEAAILIKSPRNTFEVPCFFSEPQCGSLKEEILKFIPNGFKTRIFTLNSFTIAFFKKMDGTYSTLRVRLISPCTSDLMNTGQAKREFTS